VAKGGAGWENLRIKWGTTKDTKFHEKGQQGDAQGTCAGTSETDLLTSKLADSPDSESPTHSVSGPASLPATSHSLLVTVPEALSPATRHPPPAPAPERMKNHTQPVGGLIGRMR